MRYPANTPIVFTNQRSFIEQFGDQVWTELCDTIPLDKPVRVHTCAELLPALDRYKRKSQYLRAVLFAVETDYNERPEVYEFTPPFRRVSDRLDLIIL